MFVAVGAEFFQFHAPGSIAAVLAGSIARNPRRSLVRVGAALSTFEGNDDADSFLAGHDGNVTN